MKKTLYNERKSAREGEKERERIREPVGVFKRRWKKSLIERSISENLNTESLSITV